MLQHTLQTQLQIPILVQRHCIALWTHLVIRRPAGQPVFKTKEAAQMQCKARQTRRLHNGITQIRQLHNTYAKMRSPLHNTSHMQMLALIQTMSMQQHNTPSSHSTYPGRSGTPMNAGTVSPIEHVDEAGCEPLLVCDHAMQHDMLSTKHPVFLPTS